MNFVINDEFIKPDFDEYLTAISSKNVQGNTLRQI